MDNRPLARGGFGRFGRTPWRSKGPHFEEKATLFKIKVHFYIEGGQQIAVTHLHTVVYRFSFFRLEQNTWDLQQSRVATLENMWS